MSKKTVIIIELILLFLLGWVIGLGIFYAWEENHQSNYTLPVQIVAVDENTQEITCEDENGNLWVFNGWLEEGKTIQLEMSTNKTESIYDDVIVSVSLSD